MNTFEDMSKTKLIATLVSGGTVAYVNDTWGWDSVEYHSGYQVGTGGNETVIDLEVVVRNPDFAKEIIKKLIESTSHYTDIGWWFDESNNTIVLEHSQKFEGFERELAFNYARSKNQKEVYNWYTKQCEVVEYGE